MGAVHNVMLAVGILVLGISLVTLVYQGDITGRVAKRLSAEDIKPLYAREQKFVGCEHFSMQCDGDTLQECRGGRWFDVKVCLKGCQKDTCIDQPAAENVKKSNQRVFGQERISGAYKTRGELE